MRYFKLEPESYYLNPNGSSRDASFEKNRYMFGIDGPLRIPPGPFDYLDLDINFLEYKASFEQGVPPRDYINMGYLNLMGIIFSYEAKSKVNAIYLPKFQEFPISILCQGQLLTYYWYYFNFMEVFEGIDVQQSKFYSGNDYWGKRNELVTDLEELLVKIKTLKTVETALSIEKLIVKPDFDYDLFKLPKLDSRFFCSERFVEWFEGNSFAGLTFSEARIFSQ